MWTTARTFALPFLAAFCLAAVPAAARECIGVIPAGGGLSFWGEVGRGAHQAGEESGVDIYYRGPYDENNPDSQREILSIIHRMKCAALVLAPNVPERAAEISQFAREGIPTVLIDRDFGKSAAVAFVGTDNFHAGELAAVQMARVLGKGGRVAVFHMKRGVQSTDDRERGFIAAARQAGLEIVLEDWIGNNVGEARLQSQKALEGFKGRLDGLFTPNESTTLATMVSLQVVGLAGKVKLIGFDMNQSFIDAMQRQYLYGVVVQRPVQMGYQGVRLAYAAMKGKMPERYTYDTGAFFVTGATLRLPEFAQDLAPFLGPADPTKQQTQSSPAASLPPRTNR